MRRMVSGGLLVSALALSTDACDTYPTRPSNRSPTISSVVAFPTVLALGDSMIVTVNASDPDGDTLVYDWEAVNGLMIKGDPYPDGILYHTSSPSRVFYLQWRPESYDTAWIWCGVRDVRGGGDTKRVVVTLRD